MLHQGAGHQPEQTAGLPRYLTCGSPRSASTNATLSNVSTLSLREKSTWPEESKEAIGKPGSPRTQRLRVITAAPSQKAAAWQSTRFPTKESRAVKIIGEPAQSMIDTAGCEPSASKKRAVPLDKWSAAALRCVEGLEARSRARCRTAASEQQTLFCRDVERNRN